MSYDDVKYFKFNGSLNFITLRGISAPEYKMMGVNVEDIFVIPNFCVKSMYFQ